MSEKRYEKLVEVRAVTFKDGAVWRTHFLREEWVPIEIPMYTINDKNEQIVTLSSQRQRELNYKTHRTVKAEV